MNQEKKESREGEFEPMVIKMPEGDNREFEEKLKAKLKEYRERLRKQKEGNPEAAADYFTDTVYKITILSDLLSLGTVDTEKVAKDLKEVYGGIADRDFDNAAKVINDYVSGRIPL